MSAAAISCFFSTAVTIGPKKRQNDHVSVNKFESNIPTVKVGKVKDRGLDLLIKLCNYGTVYCLVFYAAHRIWFGTCLGSTIKKLLDRGCHGIGIALPKTVNDKPR